MIRLLRLWFHGLTPQRAAYIASREWLEEREWIKLSYQAKVNHNGTCMCCGKSRREGIYLNSDHIKPRKTHPWLALKESNIQVLCNLCNAGKGNWDSTDWRSAGEKA